MVYGDGADDKHELCKMAHATKWNEGHQSAWCGGEVFSCDTNELWLHSVKGSHRSILSNRVSWTDMCFRGKSPQMITVIIQALDISRHKSPHQVSASGNSTLIYLLILSFPIPNISDFSVHSDHLWKCKFWYSRVGMKPKSLHFLQAQMLQGIPVHGQYCGHSGSKWEPLCWVLEE